MTAARGAGGGRSWLMLSYCFLLLQQTVRPQNVSPCPRLFQYVFDGADWIGILEIPSPMLGQIVTVHVHLTIRAVLPSSYFGRIELMSPRSQILQDILAHRPVRYRVRFPLPSPIPKLTAIVLNGQPICSAMPDTGGIITTIKLEHTLYTTTPDSGGNSGSNSLYSGINAGQQMFGFDMGGATGSHQRPSVSHPDNDLWTFEIRPHQSSDTRPLQPQNPPFRPRPPSVQPQKPQDFHNQGFQESITTPPHQTHNHHTAFNPPPRPQQPATDWGNLHHQHQTQRPDQVAATRPTVVVPPFRPPITTPPPSRVGVANPYTVLQEMDSVCGQAVSRPNNLVVRGEVAGRGDWPWMVALFVITDTGLNFNCGASLVSRKIVVTAAHCLFGPDNRQHDNEKILLIIGRYNINDWTDNAIRAPIERAVPHPDYRQNTLGTDADIAIVILRERVQFTELIRPLCLWKGNDRLDNIVGLNGTVVGWGRDESGHKTTPEPRLARVPVVSRETCLLSKEEFRHLITSNRTFCAGAKGSGPCNGDSGGGLVLPQGNRWALRGIVSVSLVDQITKQCDVNEFIVFTDATQFLTWIISYMLE